MSRPHRSGSDSSQKGSPTPSDPGAAQFIANLSPKQLRHLQFSVPPKDQPERFSQFLEGPRQVPVPNRFTFNALDLAARRQERKTPSKKNVKHVRIGSDKSRKSISSRNRSASTGTSDASSTFRGSMDLLKVELHEVKTTVREFVPWKFWATGVSMAMLNLVVAWDTTKLPVALPVSWNLELRKPY
jgi:hypothetical protein